MTTDEPRERAFTECTECTGPEFFDLSEDHQLWRCAHLDGKRVALIACETGLHIESIGLELERHLKASDVSEAFRIFFDFEAQLIGRDSVDAPPRASSGLLIPVSTRVSGEQSEGRAME